MTNENDIKPIIYTTETRNYKGKWKTVYQGMCLGDAKEKVAAAHRIGEQVRVFRAIEGDTYRKQMC